MRKDVEETVRGCLECNTRGSGREERRPLLQPAERVGIDFTDITKEKDGNLKILVMIDHAMKFVIVKAAVDGSLSRETTYGILNKTMVDAFDKQWDYAEKLKE